MRPARKEALGFRDEELSEWHRTLGHNFPATDLDFILLEYNAGKPSAVIEYKHFGGKKFARKHPSFESVRLLCDPARVPFFIVRYQFTGPHKSFVVYPMNAFAAAFCPHSKQIMGESQFIRLLERLRQGDKK